MKRLLSILFLVLWIASNSDAQQRIRDPHIVGQEKRQVFQQWGDWRPNPKYFLGVQISYNHALVWGWMAPDRNQRYRKGSDIRPLGPAGLQNQRYATLLAQEAKAKEIRQDVQDVTDETVDEYLHQSALLANTDPLYILYYKRMLTKLHDFNVNSPNSNDWGFDNRPAWERANKYGLLNESKRKIEVLQDKYKYALNEEMPRGKRIIMYHELLMEWRKLDRYLAYLNNQGKNALKAQERIDRYERMKRNGEISRERRDAEIFMDVVYGRN